MSLQMLERSEARANAVGGKFTLDLFVGSGYLHPTPFVMVAHEN